MDEFYYTQVFLKVKYYFSKSFTFSLVIASMALLANIMHLPTLFLPMGTACLSALPGVYSEMSPVLPDPAA